jgi:hypothetical protein
MRAIKIRADAKFWRHWHGNKDQMRQIGYRCRKVGDRWHAWLLIGGVSGRIGNKFGPGRPPTS